jgi:hypothetical protein
MLRLVTAATTEPVSVAEARLQVRATADEFDAILPRLITAAREVVEQQTGYALAAASYEWTPEGDNIDPPIKPATVTSAVDVTPVLFTTAPGPAPAALKQAILLMVSDLLKNTDANAERELAPNPAFENLIFPYRRVLP